MPIGRFVAWTAALVWVAAMPVAVGQKSNLTRERGALYIEDFTDQPIALRVNSPAPVYNNLRGGRSLGVLLPGQMASLVAFSEKACRVRGRAAHGDVVGWVGVNHLDPKDPNFFDRMRQMADRQREVEKLIAHKEVAIGMTPDEVIRALGRPTAENSRTDSNSRSLSFQYITYDRIPQRTLARDRFGRLVRTITYIKVETGRFTVNFTDDAVSSFETTRGEPNFNNSKIVIPPITVW